jgi:Mrp family chromosome partitioning ATPase
MTAPRASAMFSSVPARVAAVVAPVAPIAPIAPAIMPAVRDTHPDLGADVGEIDQLANELRDEGEAARKITIMGTGQNETITLTALTLARLLARSAKVVLVDLSPSSPTLTAVSVDPAAPGLADLMLGEASFGQVITRDKLSSVHLVGAGRPGTDRALLQSPRLTLALDALLRVYDHVLLDAGTATDLPARLLTENARAILVPDPSMSPEARTRMREQLQAIGFGSVTTLSRPSQPSDIQTGPRVAA